MIRIPRRHRLAPLGAVLLVTAAQVRLLLDPVHGSVHLEEGYDAALAVALGWAPVEDLLWLQYRPFCGGCSLDVLTAHALFRVLPPVALTWKLVPLGWFALLALLTFVGLDRAAGRVAAWAGTLLLAAPAPLLAHNGVVAWGNHVLAGVLGTALLVRVDARRGARAALGTGLLAAAALAASLSSAPFVAAALIVLARRSPRELAAAAAPLPLAALPGLGIALRTGRSPLDLFASPAFADGQSLAARAATLLAPGTVVRLFGEVDPGDVGAGAVTAAVFAVALVRALVAGPALPRSAALAALAWGVAYLLAPAGFGTSGPPYEQLRYAAPLLVTAPVLIGALVGALHARGRSGLAAAALAAGLAGGVPDRVRLLASPPRLAHLVAVDAAAWHHLAWYGLANADRIARWRCPEPAPTCAALVDYARGWQATPELLDAADGAALGGSVAAWAGFGASLAADLDRHADPAVALRAVVERLDAAGATPSGRRAALLEAAQVADHAAPRWEDATDDEVWRALAADAGLRTMPCDRWLAPPHGLDAHPALLAAWREGVARRVRAEVATACPAPAAELPPGVITDRDWLPSPLGAPTRPR